MARVRPDHSPPPPPAQARPPVPVRELPQAYREYGRSIDDRFGDGDGQLETAELDTFARQFGHLVEHQAPIAALRRVVDPVAVAGTTGPSSAESEALARSLVRAGGSGTSADVQAVVAELARVPAPVLRLVDQAGIRVVACRGSVTDHIRSLRGETPRGWPPGVTWDTVPGTYWPPSRTVVVATMAGPAGDRQVPPSGRGHGSWSLAVHEMIHGLDYQRGFGTAGSRDPAFLDAWRADRSSLDAYLAQPEPAGPEEAFAELAAGAFLDKASVAGAPNLNRYFAALERSLGLSP